jgi:hypothetical protein
VQRYRSGVWLTVNGSALREEADNICDQRATSGKPGESFRVVDSASGQVVFEVLNG